MNLSYLTRISEYTKFLTTVVSWRKLHHALRPANGISYSYGMPQEPLLSLTIPDVIRAAAAETSDRTFIVSQHQQLHKTFSELSRDANCLAHGLQKLGVKRGDRVGIWSPNCYEWIVTQFGTAKLGAVMVAVNPAYREREFLYCAKLVNCHTLIFAQTFKSSNYCEILNNISPAIWKKKDSLTFPCQELPDLKNLICLSPLPGTREAAAEHVSRFDDIIKYSSDQEFIDEAITFDDAINIQFTSGTTGSPKGATLSHHGAVNNAYFSGQRLLKGLLREGKGASICVPNPLYHCYGSVNGCLTAALYRSTVVLPGPTAQAADTLRAIDRFKCNIVYGTPTMYVDILSQSRKGLDLTSIERAVMSGAPCPKETILRVKKDVFPNCTLISIPYGATETSPTITVPPADVPEKYAYDTVGRAVDHVEVKIADPSGSVVRLGESGEVMTRGFHTFIGYWNQAEKTAEVLDDRHWYHTGDTGVMNEDGYISIIGRIKDMIIRGGENVYPREIEDFLLTHESVLDVNVVGVPDARLGEEICAFVILKQGCGTGDEEDEVKQQLTSYCRGQIAHFKVPKHVILVPDFPRTVTMKVQKHKLKEMAIQLLPVSS